MLRKASKSSCANARLAGSAAGSAAGREASAATAGRKRRSRGKRITDRGVVIWGIFKPVKGPLKGFRQRRNLAVPLRLIAFAFGLGRLLIAALSARAQRAPGAHGGGDQPKRSL